MIRISAKYINNVELMFEERVSSAVTRAKLGLCCELLKSSAITKITPQATERLLTQIALAHVIADGAPSVDRGSALMKKAPRWKTFPVSRPRCHLSSVIFFIVFYYDVLYVDLRDVGF